MSVQIFSDLIQIQNEFEQIESTLKQGGIDAEIVYVVVQKKINTRFFMPGMSLCFPRQTELYHIQYLIDIRQLDRKSTRLNSSHSGESRMPSSA